MNGTESYVELRFFSPFDINKIPERIVETIYEEVFTTTKYKIESPHQLTLKELLLAICDEDELKNGIRKELIKYYNK